MFRNDSIEKKVFFSKIYKNNKIGTGLPVSNGKQLIIIKYSEFNSMLVNNMCTYIIIYNHFIRIQ